MTTHPSQKPITEEEWIIHSINIHGVFFERWCHHVILTTANCSVRSVNYPVEFPPPNGPIRGKESALDIRAQVWQGDTLLTLVVECKKNDPEYSKWMFFPKYPHSQGDRIIVREIERKVHAMPEAGWDTVPGVRRSALRKMMTSEAREVKSDYVSQSTTKDQNKLRALTKTANASITDAANQVALATQALLHEETSLSSLLSTPEAEFSIPWRKQVFLPIIVTSARLFRCNFGPGDVDALTGELPYAKATISEEPYLFYEYPLPPHLQSAPSNRAKAVTQEVIDLFTRMHILVVHSGSLTEVLRRIAQNHPASTDLDLDFFL